MPAPSATPWTSVVLPAPRSPTSATASPAASTAPRAAAAARVSASPASTTSSASTPSPRFRSVGALRAPRRLLLALRARRLHGPARRSSSLELVVPLVGDHRDRVEHVL